MFITNNPLIFFPKFLHHFYYITNNPLIYITNNTGVFIPNNSFIFFTKYN